MDGFWALLACLDDGTAVYLRDGWRPKSYDSVYILRDAEGDILIRPTPTGSAVRWTWPRGLKSEGEVAELARRHHDRKCPAVAVAQRRPGSITSPA
jgi:hypothetical protein